ncbi:MAG: transposase [Xanthomonadales bacterium]|nr:transposase [Xanthomonadales bacterium]
MRRPRLELPGIPLHVTQRGVNRCANFLDEDDYAAYFEALRSAATDQDVAVHGWVLMGNHVHLLLSADLSGAVSRMMQAVGRRYVRAFNQKYARTGTLWEGRFRSCLVDTEHYVLTCLRYIELNPVRAGLAALPWEYRWSSVHANLGLQSCRLLRPHPMLLALGDDRASALARYRELLLEPIDSAQLDTVREHMRQERALGSPRFQAMVEKTLQRPVSIRGAGRPAGKSRDQGCASVRESGRENVL